MLLLIQQHVTLRLIITTRRRKFTGEQVYIYGILAKNQSSLIEKAALCLTRTFDGGYGSSDILRSLLKIAVEKRWH